MTGNLVISDGLKNHPAFPTYNLPLIIPTLIDAVRASTLCDLCTDIRRLSTSSLELCREADTLNMLVLRCHGVSHNSPRVNNDNQHNAVIQAINALRAEMAAMRRDDASARGDIRADMAHIRGDMAHIRGDMAHIRGDIGSIRGDIAALSATFDRHYIETDARAAFDYAVQVNRALCLSGSPMRRVEPHGGKTLPNDVELSTFANIKRLDGQTLDACLAAYNLPVGQDTRRARNLLLWRSLGGQTL